MKKVPFKGSYSQLEKHNRKDEAMKIAIAANGATMEDLVPDTFEESAFILIVETDDGSYDAFRNPEEQGSAGLALTREVVKHDCEAVICGSIEKEAFEELAEAQVTRYMGANHRATDALNMMEAYQLDFIRVPNGETWDPDGHDHGAPNCDNHEG